MAIATRPLSDPGQHCEKYSGTTFALIMEAWDGRARRLRAGTQNLILNREHLNMNMKYLLLTATVAAAGLAFNTAQAAAVTANMPVTITIQNACEITLAPTTLDFGTHGVLSANIDSSSVLTVTCTTGADYDIGLNGGASGNINARTMTNGTDFVGYQLYTEAGRTNVWGNTVGTDTLAAVGTGTVQQFAVYGRVPPQTTPPAGTYTDTVAVTVTY